MKNAFFNQVSVEMIDSSGLKYSCMGFSFGDSETISLVVGFFSEKTKLYDAIQPLRSDEKHVQTRKRVTLTTLVKPIKEVLGNFLVIRSAKSVETTHIEAPEQHHIDNAHTDGDEYGDGISIVIYPRVDNTVVRGRILIMNDVFDDIEVIESVCDTLNENFGYTIASYENRFDTENNQYENVLCINNKIEIDGMVPFVSFDGDTIHQVEQIEGTGVREAVFVYIDGIFKDTEM